MMAPCVEGDTDRVCDARYGNRFDSPSSNTFQPDIGLNATGLLNVSYFDPGFEHNASSGTDALGVDGVVQLTTFPVEIWSGQSVNRTTYDPRRGRHHFGFGNSSTALGSLLQNGLISFRTFSLFARWKGEEATHQLDGNLMLGGLDLAKLTAHNITLPFAIDFNCQSGFQVSIMDISLNFPDGKNHSIFDESQLPGQGCISPVADFVALRQNMWSAFLKSSGSSGSQRRVDNYNVDSMTISSSGAFAGDMTITISPGLDIRIPNHQLILPVYDFDEQGQQINVDPGRKNVLAVDLGDGGNKNDWLTLGKPFLSSAYLFADYERNTFTLWESNSAADTTPISVPPASCGPFNPIQGAIANTSTSVVSVPDKSSEQSPEKRQMSTAVLAGIIIGPIGALTMLLYLSYKLFQARRKNERDHFAKCSKDHGWAWFLSKPELATDRQPPQEVASHGIRRHGKSIHEMPGIMSYSGTPQALYEATELPALTSSQISRWQ